MRPRVRSRIWRYGLATGTIAAALVLRELLLPGAGDKSPFQTFVLAILVSSLAGGLGPGLYATGLGTILAATLYLPPLGEPSVGEASDVIRIGLFVVQGIVAAMLGEMVRRGLARDERLADGVAHIRHLLRLQGAARLLPSSEPLVEPLTDRELEVVRLAALGLRNHEIAETLYLSDNTVKTHLAHAYGKLGVRTRTEAVTRCAALGLLEPPLGSSVSADSSGS